MQGYVDIHSHILPGVDDGAGSPEMSMRMLRMADAEGIRQIILTPHNKPMRHNVSAGEMEQLMERLRNAIEQEGLRLQLYSGSEVYYRSGILDALEEGNACTMAASSYVLVEFGPMDDFSYIRNGVYQLTAGGYQPILAHAERYAHIGADIGRVGELIEMGCYIQVNAGSIMGDYGYKTKHLARRLLKHRLVHFIATDSHNDGKRSPALARCAGYVSKKFGEQYMQELFCINPGCVIANEYI